MFLIRYLSLMYLPHRIGDLEIIEDIKNSDYFFLTAQVTQKCQVAGYDDFRVFLTAQVTQKSVMVRRVCFDLFLTAQVTQKFKTKKPPIRRFFLTAQVTQK